MYALYSHRSLQCVSPKLEMALNVRAESLQTCYNSGLSPVPVALWYVYQARCTQQTTYYESDVWDLGPRVT